MEDSSGNGGASIAGYGAAGGFDVKIVAPASTTPGKIAQIHAYGADVELTAGPREASQEAAIRQATGEVFYASHNWQAFSSRAPRRWLMNSGKTSTSRHRKM